MAPDERTLTDLQRERGPDCHINNRGLIKIRAPGELNPTIGNIRNTQGGVAVEYPFDRKVPLDAVRIFLVPTIRSEEGLRTDACVRGVIQDVGESEESRVSNSRV
jgi:hypothetical protein